MRSRRGILLFAACSAVAVSLSPAAATAQNPPPSPTPPAVANPSPPVDPRAEALAHFEKGNALFKAGAVDGALAEFMSSLRLYPTKSATSNAALCLTQLQRFDEALDLVESLLKEFPDLPEDLRSQAQRELVRLRGLVGTIDIAATEIGAAIFIDGQRHGEYPAIAPLRVAAGSHTVRVYKEGFEPFEGRLDVAGGEIARVVARLRPLVQPGRASIAERGGKLLDVIVDGNSVGKTPWEGPLSTGEHTVLLRGEGALGTQPASLPIRPGQTTQLTLAAEELEAEIRVNPTPAGASVAIDSVTVGHGLWRGRLRAGPHKIEVLNEGFVASTQQVQIERGERRLVAVSLQRDLSSPFWPKPLRSPRFLFELDGAGLFALTFSDVHIYDPAPLGGRATMVSHDKGVGAGGAFAIHGGYELGFGLGFGVTAAVLAATQTVTYTGVFNLSGATTLLDGFLLGAWAGLTLGSAFPVHFRLDAGGLFGRVSNTFTRTQGGSLELDAATRFLVLMPDVRVGLPLGRRLELNAGLSVPIIIDAPRPHPTDPNYYMVPIKVMIAPGFGVRYDF